MPSRVKEIDPEFSICTDLFFTGFDPPRTLVPAVAMAPDITTSDSKTLSTAPTPSPTQDPGARKTTSNNEASLATVPAPAPEQTRNVPQPKTTTDGSDAKQEGTDQQVPISDPRTQQNGSEQEGHASPDQMSQVESALGPSSQDQPMPAQTQGTNPFKTGLPLGDGPSSGTALPESTSEQLNSSPENLSHPNHPTLPAGKTANPQQIEQTTVPIAGPAIAADQSATYLKGSQVNPDVPLKTVSGEAAISQGNNSITGGDTIIHLPPPTSDFPTTITSDAISPIPNSVSIQDNVITAGASPVTISDSPISVDPSSYINLGDSSYWLPPPPNSPLMPTLANGAVATQLSHGSPLQDTTLIAGASPVTVSGTPISFETSKNRIFGDNFTPTLFSPSPSISDNSMSLTPGRSGSFITKPEGQAITTPPSVGDITSSTQSPGLTVTGILTFLGSTGELVVGSRTYALESSSTSLGGAIMGGFGPGGLSTTGSPSSPQEKASTGPGTSPSNEVHANEGSAARIDSFLLWKLATALIATSLVFVLV